uniref:Uncharacterized protein n=1 Tax=Arundo donax TaxID=35708 RepID=A0A0A8Y3C8_ARUDO
MCPIVKRGIYSMMKNINLNQITVRY